MDEDVTPPPFIAIWLGKECQQTYAFIDFGENGNTISYELFGKLEDVKVIETNSVFQAYTGHTTREFGMSKLELNVSELICGASSLSPYLRCRMYLDVHGKESTTVFSIGVAY